MERFSSRLGQNSRMSEDHEGLCITAESFVYITITRLMVKRLARAQYLSDGLCRIGEDVKVPEEGAQ